jgi:predicted nucleotidyltransferase
MKSIYLKERINSILESKEVEDVFNKYNISSVITFGSINTDDFNEESDVDIAIIGENKIKLGSILELEMYLESLLNREIDVIDLKSENLDLFLKIGILNEGRIIYSNDNSRCLQKFKEKLDRIYRENENFIYFRKKDVLS